MSGKIVEVNCAAGHLDSLLSSAEASSASVISSHLQPPEQQRVTVRLYVADNRVQATIDRLQSMLPVESEPLLLIVPVDAKIGGAPETLLTDEVDQVVATREELFASIEKGTECDLNFVLLAILATIVTAVGLAEDNVAVVIGAMVIAPLLGPNLALALGAALGDRELIKTAILANLVGVSITIGLAILIALVWPPNLDSHELMSRTQVQLSSVVLALAAGVAAVQSLITRLANLLVGVMVAVALVPPATVVGMMLGMQEWQLASGAALLLMINIAAVNFAAQLVFLFNGVRPRTWVAQRKAAQSSWINIAVWALLLAMGIALFTLLPLVR